ncbi:MAG: thymidylate synthase [Candidatus Woesearchaeota archaeon]
MINEKTCIESWKKALRRVIDEGEDFIDTDKRQCREILNLVIAIENPEKDYEKLIDALKKFEWVYPTTEELSSIILNKENLAMYEFSYGPRIFNFLGKKDQVHDFIIPLLKNDPNSRRAIISLFNPQTDSDVLNKNIPSLMLIHFKIKGDKLNCTCVIRSNDIFIGWPGNIYQIYLLQKYVAEKLNVKTGMLSTISCSAHIFHEHFDNVKKVI